MDTDTIKVHTTQLQTSSQTAKTGSADTKNLSNDMGTAISDVVSALASVDVLAAVGGALETFNTGLMATLECFALGLQVIDSGLRISAEAFKGLDAKLASTFSTLEGRLGYYTGYETTFTMPTVHVPTGPITLKTTTLSYQLPPQHQSFWGSVGSFFSGVGHFIAHHALQVGAVLGAAVMVAGGIILTPETGGLSDVGAVDGAAALLDAAGVASIPEGATQATFALAA
ncbi:MAG TPA: hypothetical protein VKV19_19465 [Ktedonobacteraceae bacterium]|nr:hypothetical protein [Ktedonobacteraceae bacterium]